LRVGQIRFGISWEGVQWFIAGWSSPVARQAHNLKVIGSNPIPATKINPVDQGNYAWSAGFFHGAMKRRGSLPTITNGF
jgi:hypothetical protein